MKRTLTQQQKNSLTRKLLLSVMFVLTTAVGFCQYNVTEIITDYNGYWKSAAALNNTVKPDNSHNLVSFSFNGNRYSTGVNDALLTSKGQSFIAGDYRALPVNSVSSTVTSNTKIGLGYMYDGNANGAGSPAPVNNIPYYLTDGIKGLDLGTCVANLPEGTLNFSVSSVLKPSLGDGVPDIVITQIADPSGSQDRYEFTDIDGKVVGNYVDILLTNIPPVGNWTADFYEASTSPMTLAGGFTKTDRPIRLWASDLSAFGINSTNASQVAYFKIVLSGNSDVAFVAYNNSSINIINSLLPVTLSSFSGKAVNNQVQLNWQTVSTTNSDAFVIEKSINGDAFTATGTVLADANSTTAEQYAFTDNNPTTGKNYYRLKMIDKDGQTSYSKVIVVTSTIVANTAISCYPNPATSYVIITHPFAGSNESLRLVNMQGNAVWQQAVAPATFQTRIDLPVLPKGMYQLVWANGKEMTVNQLVIL